MRKPINLVEQKFGRLLVLEDIGRKRGYVLWRCLCECGNTIEVSSDSLRQGNTQSCGCYMKDRITEANKKDLVGQVYGRLTVLEDIGRDIQRNVIWKCVCECGHIVHVSSDNLQSGDTKSCGCYMKDRITETQSGENHWNWKGGITSLRVAVRTCLPYLTWRRTIFQRDNFTCVHCDTRGGDLIAHHLNLFSDIMEENHITSLEEALQCEALWEVSNGITLCVECHEEEHTKT